MATPRDDKRNASTAELVKELSREVSQLVREEIALAKAEMTQKGKHAGIGAGMLSGAAVLGLAAVGGSMAFFVLVLNSWMPGWLAALIVTAAYAAAAGLLALRGKGTDQPRNSSGTDANDRISKGGRAMGEDPRDVELRIEDTRERMGDTVEALSAKADVPGRVKGYVEDKKDAVTCKVSDAKEKVTGVAGSTGDSGGQVASQAAQAARKSAGIVEGESTRSRDRIRRRWFPARHGSSLKPDRGRASRADV